jgi:hypothetical protein
MAGKRIQVAVRGLTALLALLLLTASCGYRFTPVGGVVPDGAKTIAIPVFINDTMEPYIDIEVTKAVVDEFLVDGRLKVVSVETADLVLRGRVTSFVQTPQSYSGESYVQSYTIGIGASVTLEDVRTKKTLLRDQGLGTIFTSGYAVALGNISGTRVAKDAAVKNSSKDLASTLRSRVLEGF